MPDLPTQLGTTLRFISSSKLLLWLPGASVEAVLLPNFSLFPILFPSLSFIMIDSDGARINLLYANLQSLLSRTQLAILTDISNTDACLKLNMDLGKRIGTFLYFLNQLIAPSSTLTAKLEIWEFLWTLHSSSLLFLWLPVLLSLSNSFPNAPFSLHPYCYCYGSSLYYFLPA